MKKTQQADWQSIQVDKPNVGDLIACYAPAAITGLIYWAGIVTANDGRQVTMRTGAKRVNEREFIITDDTHWLLLPPARKGPVRVPAPVPANLQKP